MTVHKFTRETGEVVEFQREANEAAVRVFIDGQQTSRIKLEAPAHRVSAIRWAQWDAEATRKAKDWEKQDRQQYADLIASNTK